MLDRSYQTVDATSPTLALFRGGWAAPVKRVGQVPLQHARSSYHASRDVERAGLAADALGVNKEVDLGVGPRSHSLITQILLIVAMTAFGAALGGGGLWLRASSPNEPSIQQVVVFAIIGAVVLGAGTTYGLAKNSWKPKSPP